MTANAIKHNKKPTATPPSTVISAKDNRFLPPWDNNDDKHANPSDLMGKYDGRGKKKVNGEYRHRDRDNKNDIEALHGLYKEPKDDNKNGHEDEDDGGNWNNTEEKEREEDNDDNDGIVDITAVQCFGMTNEVFLGKETDNKKSKKEEEK